MNFFQDSLGKLAPERSTIMILLEQEMTKNCDLTGTDDKCVRS